MTVGASFFMQNPPEGWRPEGWTPTASQTSQRGRSDYTLSEALRTWQWYALWLLLFLNTFAGISIISQEAPIFQELVGVSAIVAASMVGIASIGNAFGRVFWAWVSDLITRRATFFVMFVVQVLLFWFLPSVTAVSVMTIVAFVVLMCYGGGFGTMPAFVADYFGSKNVGPIYGLMLTAWGCASVAGPGMIAYMRDNTGSYHSALNVIALVMAISALLPILVVRPEVTSDTSPKRLKAFTGSAGGSPAPSAVTRELISQRLNARRSARAARSRRRAVRAPSQELERFKQ
jgi:OFA family oxalate/formate antiporter-like MFS transporter